MKKRIYNQYCAIARALDVIGERWTLLLIRELMTGPKRFTDLLDHLPGLGTNLLSSRLKELEEQALITQTRLPRPASSVVYTLTPRGEELEPVLLALASWGRPLLGPPKEKDTLSAGWLMLAMKKSFMPDQAQGIDAVFTYEIDDDVFQVRIREESIEIEQGIPWQSDLTLTTPAQHLMEVIAGTQSVQDALENGEMKVIGDVNLFLQSFSFYGVELTGLN